MDTECDEVMEKVRLDPGAEAKTMAGVPPLQTSEDPPLVLSTLLIQELHKPTLEVK